MAAATQRHLDGPALPHLGHFPLGRGGSANADAARLALAPVLTPPVGGAADWDAGQQYLIVPNERRIVVRSAQHGGRVCELTPSRDGGDGEREDVTVRTVSLAWLAPPEDGTADGEGDGDSDGGGGGEHVVLAGYSDGTLREWAVSDVASPRSGGTGGLAPRRTFRLRCGTMRDADLAHLSSPAGADASAVMSPRGGAIVYAWIRGVVGKRTTASCLGRLTVPAFSGDGPGGPIGLEVDRLATRETVSSKTPPGERAERERVHVCLRKHDDVVHLVASHRQPRRDGGGILERYNLEDGGAPRGEVHVVMVASHGLVFYIDSLDGDGKHRGKGTCRLVHYSKILKTSQHYSTEHSAFSAASVSPGTEDLALGRANGHIELLVGVFENNRSYLDGLSAGGDAPAHPEEVTVRRTMHWHAHPVRTLAYVPSSGGGRGAPRGASPLTLVSGGEESVLVTWQLDRNHHRPSDFVARVGRGGIVRLIPCPDTDRTFVFCADNSVQCYDSTSSERSWNVRGIASMALYEEEADVGRGAGNRRGPVVVVRDPITNYPMMTNLPGAPGMVHWYDPKSSSVVGTLEVSGVRSFFLSHLPTPNRPLTRAFARRSRPTTA